MKKRMISALALLLASATFSAAGCKYLSKGDYQTLTDADLIAFTNALSEPQRRQLAQNAAQRKGMIDQFKQMFSIAQAAQAEGLDKGEDFARTYALQEARVLANEFSKRNPEFVPDKAALDAYIAAHQKDFDADIEFVTRKSPQKPDAAQLDVMKPQWSELQVRAEKARAAGLTKDPNVAVQLKFAKANLLADLYANKLQDKFKPTEGDFKTFYAEHPEVNPDGVKTRVAGLLERIKKGETTFEKIADETNEDGTRGKGGDLGCFGKGAMDPDFEKAAFGLASGQITQEPVKSKFGYHLIKSEGPCKDDKPASGPGAPPAPAGGSKEEKIKAKHIYISTSAGEEMMQQQQGEKIKKEMDELAKKFPVSAPTDFTLKVEGLREVQGTPAPGSGVGGSMKQIDPQANK